MQSALRILDLEGMPFLNDVVRKEHNIGQSTCPDPLPPVVAELPPEFEGAEIPVTTDVSWLELPDFITSGEPFDMLFNCGINDFTNHSEIAEVKIDLEAYAESHPGLEHTAGTPSGGTFFVVMDTCNGPCPDFALPYICTSDCPPVEYIESRPPAPQE